LQEFKSRVYQRLTDLYGDIHRKQERLFGGILTPKYDLQSDIYADMLKNWKNQLLI
jgi:hypothetical protein